MRVYVTNGIIDPARAYLQKHGATFVPRIDAAEVVWCRPGEGPPGVWLFGPDARYVVSATTGLDHVPVEQCANNGIRIISLQGEVDLCRTIWSTAELTVCLMLNLLRKVPQAIDAANRGEWDRHRFIGRDLRGRRVLLIGDGRVSSQVRKMLFFGFDIRSTIAANPPNLFAVADSEIVSVHIPGTEPPINGRLFDHCLAVVNTSRPHLIDPPPTCPYAVDGYHAVGSIVTPHIGGCTVEGLTTAETFCAKELVKAWRTQSD